MGVKKGARKEVNMPRIARKDLNTSFFHIIVQGINKEYIFYKETYMKKYLQLIDKYREDYGVTIISYCIMNNHTHLLIYTEKIEEMSNFMHKINGVFAQYYNQNENRVGVVFRNRFISEPIYNEKYLIQCIKYIHQNPVKAGIVDECRKYEYSTYNDYIDNVGVAKSKILLDIFGNVNYKELFNQSDEDEIFKDIDNDEFEVLENGIKVFENKVHKQLEEILSEKEILKELVRFLKNNYKVTYVNIRKRFNISRGKMDRLK